MQRACHFSAWHECRVATRKRIAPCIERAIGRLRDKGVAIGGDCNVRPSARRCARVRSCAVAACGIDAPRQNAAIGMQRGEGAGCCEHSGKSALGGRARHTVCRTAPRVNDTVAIESGERSFVGIQPRDVHRTRGYRGFTVISGAPREHGTVTMQCGKRGLGRRNENVAAARRRVRSVRVASPCGDGAVRAVQRSERFLR